MTFRHPAKLPATGTSRGLLSELISGVLGAKVLLAALCICGAVFSRRFTHHIAPSLALFWSSTIWGVCQGINMLWYFQGLERMRLASALEIGGKVVATLSIFVLVHHPDDGWKVMAAQCVGCVVAHGVTVVLAYREVGFVWPTLPSVLHALRLGWSMFLFRAAQGLTGSLNGLVLGWVAPMAALGQYAGAERISRVFQQGLWPINQALYPNLTKQMRDNRHDAMKMVRLSIFFLGGLGLLFGTDSILRGSTTGPRGLGGCLSRVDTGTARILLVDPSHCIVHGNDVPVATAKPAGLPI